jgi:hypothetical protein
MRRASPMTIGFLTYSEGCNDDVNKFVWSSLGWDPGMRVMDALRDFAHYFVGHQFAEGFAHGLQSLETNWHGPAADNDGITVTLSQFQDLERAATPFLLQNWRFQQALYRAYYDAYVRSRLLEESARLQKARDVLAGRRSRWKSGRSPALHLRMGLILGLFWSRPKAFLVAAQRITSECACMNSQKPCFRVFRCNSQWTAIKVRRWCEALTSRRWIIQ